MGLQDAIFSQQSSQTGGFPTPEQKKGGPEDLALALAGMATNPQIAPFFRLGLGDNGGTGAGTGGGGAGGGNFLFPSAGGGGTVGGAGGGGLLGSLQGALSAYNLGTSAIKGGKTIAELFSQGWDALFGTSTGGAGAPEILANPGAYDFSGALPDVSGYVTYWDPATQAFTSAPAGATAISGPAGAATAAEVAPTTEGLLANYLADFGASGASAGGAASLFPTGMGIGEEAAGITGAGAAATGAGAEGITSSLSTAASAMGPYAVPLVAVYAALRAYGNYSAGKADEKLQVTRSNLVQQLFQQDPSVAARLNQALLANPGVVALDDNQVTLLPELRQYNIGDKNILDAIGDMTRGVGIPPVLQPGWNAFTAARASLGQQWSPDLSKWFSAAPQIEGVPEGR